MTGLHSFRGSVNWSQSRWEHDKTKEKDFHFIRVAPITVFWTWKADLPIPILADQFFIFVWKVTKLVRVWWLLLITHMQMWPGGPVESKVLNTFLDINLRYRVCCCFIFCELSNRLVNKCTHKRVNCPRTSWDIPVWLLVNRNSKSCNNSSMDLCIYSRSGEGDMLELKPGRCVGLSISETADHTQPYLGFARNGLKKRKYPVSGRSVIKHSLSTLEVREEWTNWF